jgi:hypothetical protein
MSAADPGIDGYSDVRQTQLTLSPAMAVYLAPFLNAGPLVNWEWVSYTYEMPGSRSITASKSAWGLGGKVGFIVPWSGGFFRPLPYLDLGGGVEFASSDDGLETVSDTGLLALIAGGIKLKVGECFYLSASESFTHHGTLDYENHFTTAFGFSGLIGP